MQSFELLIDQAPEDETLWSCGGILDEVRSTFHWPHFSVAEVSWWRDERSWLLLGRIKKRCMFFAGRLREKHQPSSCWAVWGMTAARTVLQNNRPSWAELLDNTALSQSFSFLFFNLRMHNMGGFKWTRTETNKQTKLSSLFFCKCSTFNLLL